jgi:hypothetical protein
MLRLAALTAAFVAVSVAAWAGPVRHAGEWETVIDNGKPLIACFPTDQTFDETTVTRQMSKVPGASCKVDSLNTAGDVTSYSMQCVINGATMVSSGTITVTGPDAFTNKAHTSGGTMKLPNGQAITMPPSDMVTVSRRLGPCKPGDRQITY